MRKALFIATLALFVLGACADPTDPASEAIRPAMISGCETYQVEVCFSWTLQGDHYVHSGDDGATANMEVPAFTSREVHLHRVDFGKHDNLTAVYSGTVSGSTASGTVTWNHAGFVRSGPWSASW